VVWWLRSCIYPVRLQVQRMHNNANQPALLRHTDGQRGVVSIILSGEFFRFTVDKEEFEPPPMGWMATLTGPRCIALVSMKTLHALPLRPRRSFRGSAMPSQNEVRARQVWTD
jgi:hypothetical protein